MVGEVRNPLSLHFSHTALRIAIGSPIAKSLKKHRRWELAPVIPETVTGLEAPQVACLALWRRVLF